MAEYEDSKHPIIQTWTLKIYCSCVGCEKKVKRVLRNIDGVHTVSVDPGEQKATVTGTLVSTDVLLKKLKEKCGKHTELWPVTQNKQKNESKTRNQHKQQNSGKDVGGHKKEHTAMAQIEMQRNEAKIQNQHTQQNSGKDVGSDKKEHTAMAEREMQRNEAKTRNQHIEQNSVKDVGGDKKEHTALAQREMQRKKPKDPKQQTEQKPGNDGAGNASNGGGCKANDNAAVAQSKMQNKTLKTQKEQNSGRHEDNGQVVEDALFTICPIVFTMEALVAATNNFHIDNKIGEGGFGPVYKGTTQDGKQIAVKKLSSKSSQGRKEFMNEKLLAKIQHRNLVNLLGCCAEGSEKFLVYEYLPNKSLDKWLSDPEKRKELDWHIRYKIILGIARGLSYLHEDSEPRIVHQDIKASNILLDGKLIPKIADFGTAKAFPEDRTAVSTGIVGTPGYMAPELFDGEQLSPKADVYSFGIVLLELLTGRKISSEPRELLGWVWSSYKPRKPDNVLRTIDPTIKERCDKEKASRCIQVGLLCTQQDSLRRPPMSEVTAMLSTSLILPVPTNPPGSNVRRRKVKRSNVRSRKVNPVDGAM